MNSQQIQYILDENLQYEEFVKLDTNIARGFRMILVIVLGILIGSSSSAETTAIAINPTALVYPLAFGLQYGKLTLELKKNQNSSYLVQISGTYLRKHNTEISHEMFDAGDSIKSDFERYQISGFLGKRWYFYHIIYAQPTFSFGYSKYHNYLTSNKSFNGAFSSALIYSGIRLGSNCVFDFNIGVGYDLFGKQSYEILAPFNADANFSIGYEF